MKAKKPALSRYFLPNRVEAGCDEAGRGCLAGPVVAAAVILPEHFELSFLNDSKQLSEKKRDEARIIVEREALAWAVGMASVAEIDAINILQASFLAMHRAISQLTFAPDALLIDGNRFKPYQNIPHECIIKGDGKMLSIAAASVLAKTHRDEYMLNLDTQFPDYQWKQNKGYPTESHRIAIKQYGLSLHHRQSFRII